MLRSRSGPAFLEHRVRSGEFGAGADPARTRHHGRVRPAEVGRRKEEPGRTRPGSCRGSGLSGRRMGLFETAMSAGIKKGQLITIMADGKVNRFGTPIEGRDPVTVRFTDKAAPRSIALNPSLGAGEAYMDGRMLLEQGDILDLLDLVTSNGRWEDRSDRKNLEWRYRGINRLIDWVQTNNQERRSK